MIEFPPILRVLGIVVVASPLTLTVGLGLASLLGRRLSEARTSRLVFASIASGLAASLAILTTMLARGIYLVPIPVGEWASIPHYDFAIKFAFDRLSVPMAILSFVLSGTIGAFAGRYMHRDRGYNRFFVLYSIFVLGMVITSLSATIETLFTGWELVGLSSALLVAFFQDRRAPATNALWIWVVYRFSDASLLLAAVVIHRSTGGGDLDNLLGRGDWPFETTEISPALALGVGTLMLMAAAGKSGLVPFSGWLPRAMEGPTPSSAVFYGALSVHLGAFLLLRVSPLLDRSWILCALVAASGLSTAAVAGLAAGVQTDIKSALAFASLSQVGLIVAEVGFGFRYLALIHLLVHASLRTLQFIRAPSLLQDYRRLEDAIGSRPPVGEAPRRPPGRAVARGRLYRFGLERGHLDAFLRDYVVRPYVRVFRRCDALERRWTDFLAGVESRESDQIRPHPVTIEELP